MGPLKIFGWRPANYIKRYFLLLIIAFFILSTGLDYWEVVSNLFEQHITGKLSGEIFSGVITTCIVSFVYILMMPIMEVSPYILKDDGKLRIKIFNSSLFPSYDTKVRLVKVSPEKASSGSSHVTLQGVRVQPDLLEYIPSMHNRRAKKHGNTFAVQVVIDDPSVVQVLNNPKDTSYYRLTIYTVGGISGLRKIYMEHYTLNSIKEGSFKSGATFALEK